MSEPTTQGGGPCVIIIEDTAEKCKALRILCNNELTTIANGANGSDPLFESRLNALNSYVTTCLNDAQDIAATYG
jgi:hypothetical protein